MRISIITIAVALALLSGGVSAGDAAKPADAGGAEAAAVAAAVPDIVAGYRGVAWGTTVAELRALVPALKEIVHDHVETAPWAAESAEYKLSGSGVLAEIRFVFAGRRLWRVEAHFAPEVLETVGLPHLSDLVRDKYFSDPELGMAIRDAGIHIVAYRTDRSVAVLYQKVEIRDQAELAAEREHREQPEKAAKALGLEELL